MPSAHRQVSEHNFPRGEMRTMGSLAISGTLNDASCGEAIVVHVVGEYGEYERR